jgi:hypothetical protein
MADAMNNGFIRDSLRRLVVVAAAAGIVESMKNGFKVDEKGRLIVVAPNGGTLEVTAPAPTGVVSTDTANVKAALQVAGESGGLASFTKPGAYAINEEVIRPANVSIRLAQGVVFKATAPFTGSCLLSDSKASKSIYQSITGGGTLDSNNVAAHALWARWFGHFNFGVICQNSLEDDVVLGDPEAAEPSYEAYVLESFGVNRTGGAVPTGHYSLWARNCSDGRIFGSTFKGQEVGVRIDLGGWRAFGAHPYGAGYPMAVCVEDRGGNEWVGTEADTPTPTAHPGAVGEATKSTITDGQILSSHEGRPVTGSNVPAGAYVGGVTVGTSFQLVNALGEAIKPTGVVAGITLLGVGILCRGTTPAKVIGGQVINNVTYGVDQGCVGVAIGRNVTGGFVQGFHSKGGSAERRVLKAIVGKSGAVSYFGMVEENTAEKVEPRSQFV